MSYLIYETHLVEWFCALSLSKVVFLRFAFRGLVIYFIQFIVSCLVSFFSSNESNLDKDLHIQIHILNQRHIDKILHV